MVKILLKYFYHLISVVFLIGSILVVFVREHINNELLKMAIDFYFWYSFGLFTGVLLARKIIESYTKLINKEKLKMNAN
ncbi:MAG: hypothetical protein EA393_00410 [Bacteroidetes bacterium]|nr:MAG: hypothetical protein EA393_00410 [Bacteroidota bacterium]